jgi:hypothetical protein
VREVIHDPHLHAVDEPAVGATAEAEAGVTGMLSRDLLLRSAVDLLGRFGILFPHPGFL